MNPANLITVGRLVLVPIVIALIVSGEWMAAFVFFALAGVSDAVDGFIARRFDMRTELGAVIDPLADKALLVSIYVTLAIVGVLPNWLAILVVSRDMMIIGAVMIAFFLEKPIAIRPLIVSKINTFAQIGFATLMLGAKAFAMSLGAAAPVAMVAVATLTIASAGAYLAVWFRHMAGDEAS